MARVITRQEMQEALGVSRLIEVSQGETYTRAHIPGAIQLSLDAAMDWVTLERVPRDQTLVLYGESSRDSQPHRLAALLEALGYDHVLIYDEGKDNWILSNLPFESNDADPTVHYDTAGLEPFPQAASSPPPSSSPSRMT